MLDALTAVLFQIFFDLAGFVLGLVQRNADLAAGTGDRSADQTRDTPVDVEEVDLLEIEEIAIEVPPLVHVAAIDVVRQVVEIVEPDTFGLRVNFAKPVEFR